MALTQLRYPSYRTCSCDIHHILYSPPYTYIVILIITLVAIVVASRLFLKVSVSHSKAQYVLFSTGIVLCNYIQQLSTQCSSRKKKRKKKVPSCRCQIASASNRNMNKGQRGQEENFEDCRYKEDGVLLAICSNTVRRFCRLR